ncbi:MAG TPA: sigma-70 family RNA polymerase sigma factor [Verrucomicrobiota bacterium]|nr:sigma-70 family RNA polymerase sigma factor [Verrucomicrobiota bacterium]HNU50018.1 sigma-70 family RNA polymerase sigma factor [Verrucomicrobiota bacterium]
MRKQDDPSIPTRSSLLNHLGDWDDHESWKTFVDTYWQPVFRIALKAGLTEEEAQDATQETILAIARKIRSFKRDPALGSFRAWLFHTARWKITDQFRKRRTGSASRQPGPVDPDATSTTERVPDPHGCELEALWNEGLVSRICG